MKSPPNKGAFTLVELLIAIAILVVLMSLALSGVQMARKRADNTKCINNLRQLGIALHLFASDNNGKIPPRLLGNNRDKNTPPLPKPKSGTPKSWTSRLIAGGYVSDPDIFYCPSFFPRNNKEAIKKADSGEACQAYGMRIWRPADDPLVSEEDRPIRIIENHSEFFILADSLWTSDGWKSQGYGIAAAKTPSGQFVHLRHQGKANTLFLDGHVEAKDQSFFDIINKPRTEGGLGQDYFSSKTNVFWTSTLEKFE